MARSSSQRKNMPTELIKDVAVAAAQQNAMERGCKFLPHGSRLFLVEQGWESITIQSDPGVVVADSLLSLEAALNDPGNKIIFIPINAMMTDQDIEKLCQRNATVKTFFKEVKKP